MQIYAPPVEDMRFLLEAFNYTGLVHSIEKFEDYDLDVVESVLAEIGRFCVNEMLPLNRVGDTQGADGEDKETVDWLQGDATHSAYLLGRGKP